MTRRGAWRWRPVLETVILAIVALGCPRPRAETAFTERVAARIRKAVPGSTVTVTAPRTLAVRYADGTTVTQRLDNLLLHCANEPQSCEASTARVVRAIAERQPIQSFAGDRERVLATLKDRIYLDNVAKNGIQVFAHRFVGDLWKVYVFDLPDTMRLVGPSDLAALKMTEDELDALAMGNLARRITDFSHEPDGDGTPVRVLHVGDSYESARLLLHDRWRVLKEEVRGDLLVSAPCRDFVYFVGSGESAKTLRSFRRQMEEIARTEHHSLSGQIFRWTPEGWVVQAE